MPPTPANRYATAFLAQFHPLTGACQWVNCGHNDGVVLRQSGDVEMLPCSGLALGLFPRMQYDEQTFELHAGDVLLIYSDGVTEANNLVQEEFSLERLISVVKDHRQSPAAEIVSRVFQQIDAFVGEAPQFDDITLMVIKRL